MSELYLGIDTSNYKTSIAVIDGNNDVVYQRSEYLEVPEGNRGLRQSECFFRHSNILPQYFEELAAAIDLRKIASVGVSSRPRRVEGSYMPCFLAGINAAKLTASILDIPLYEFSHQEGHAAAVIEDRETICRCDDDPAIMLHLSGGTTEILECRKDAEGYDLRIAGGTRDISIGQLLDRAGVAMGYSFPSGMYLDEQAVSYAECRGNDRHIIKNTPVTAIRTDKGFFNLSGTETQAMRWIESASADDYPLIAYTLLERISELIYAAASEISDTAGTSSIYMTGGVSSSAFIRKAFQDRICNGKPDFIFGKPSLSGDNAVGTARLARRRSAR